MESEEGNNEKWGESLAFENQDDDNRTININTGGMAGNSGALQSNKF